MCLITPLSFVINPEASILGGGGGGGSGTPREILGGKHISFAPPPNNFDKLKNLYVMQE